MAAVLFGDVSDLKKQPSLGGFPQPMRAQMEEGVPYKSDSQRRFFHTNTAKKAGITAADVKEFDKSSKGMKLPEKAASKAPRRHRVRYPKP